MQFAKIAYNLASVRTCARWLWTGLDLRKNPTNRAFQALKTLLAYRLLPSFQAASGRHHRGGNSMIEKSMESMINMDGATLLFPTSFGYFDPHMLKMAAKYPNIQFRHCGGLWTDGKHPKNTGSYFGYIDEAQYLAGIVAGATSKSGKLGFVAAKPIPQVLRNINAFTL